MTLLEQYQQEQHDGHRPQHRAESESPDPADLSTGKLAVHIGELVSRLVRDEITLAEVEAKQRAKRIGVGLGAFGFAGGVAFFGGCCFVAAAVLGFANVMRPWLAAIVVGAILIGTAGLVALPGWKGMMARRPPVPGDTIDSVKADVAAVREAMHHGVITEYGPGPS
jgi:hypothetical protein